MMAAMRKGLICRCARSRGAACGKFYPASFCRPAISSAQPAQDTIVPDCTAL
jgi:hypothetical protein